MSSLTLSGAIDLAANYLVKATISAVSPEEIKTVLEDMRCGRIVGGVALSID